MTSSKSNHMTDKTDRLVERNAEMRRRLRGLTKQSEDRVWRPAQDAYDLLADNIERIEALEAQVERLTEELGRIKLVLRSTLPVGSDRTPDDRVQAFYLRAGELRALRALAQDGDSHA